MILRLNVSLLFLMLCLIKYQSIMHNVTDFVKKDGYKIVKSDSEALEGIETILNKRIPIVSDVGSDIFGAVLWFRRIIGLSINGANLHEIPDDISNLSELRFLYLENNLISEIPVSIKRLNNLETFSIASNIVKNISNIPTSIKILNVSNNKLRGKVSICLPNLQEFISYRNGLSMVQFFETKNLEIVNLSNNALTSSPTSESIPSLKSLILKNNQISDLPHKIPSTIKHIDLSKNKLNANLDLTSWGALPNLNELDLSSNGLVSLRLIPNQFPSLRVLKLSNNRFQAIPKELQTMQKLEKIFLGGNQLISFDINENPWPLLKYVDLKHNPIQTKPKWLKKLKG